MSGFINPALAAFVQTIGSEFVLGQVLICRVGTGFELRHVRDRAGAPESLKPLDLAEVRSLADFTAAGAFRPLKSAPNLRDGWRLVLGSPTELEAALNQLYPNAVADWFLAQKGTAPVTDYRAFTARQTGMYRITAMLNDEAAANVVRACCHPRFCLKQRLWTVGALPVDSPQEKSAIPCLEPCAILLEFARKGMRIEQEEKVTLTLSPSDAAALAAAVTAALARGNSEIREADFGAAENPRRMQLALEKLKSSGITLASVSEEE